MCTTAGIVDRASATDALATDLNSLTSGIHNQLEFAIFVFRNYAFESCSF